MGILVASVLCTIAGCGASPHDADEPPSRAAPQCHTIVDAEFVVAHVSVIGGDAPGLLIETGEVVGGVPRRAPIEGEVEVHRDRDVVVVRADDPTRTQLARLCPFGDSDFSDAGTVERVIDVPLEALGATLRARCVFGVTISECH